MGENEEQKWKSLIQNSERIEDKTVKGIQLWFSGSYFYNSIKAV